MAWTDQPFANSAARSHLILRDDLDSQIILQLTAELSFPRSYHTNGCEIVVDCKWILNIDLIKMLDTLTQMSAKRFRCRAQVISVILALVPVSPPGDVGPELLQPVRTDFCQV